MMKALAGPLVFAAMLCTCAFYGAAIVDTSSGPPLDWSNTNQRAAGLLLFGGGGIMGMAIAALAALIVERSS